LNEFIKKTILNNLKSENIIHFDMPNQVIHENSLNCRIIFVHRGLPLNTSFELEVKDNNSNIGLDFLLSHIDTIKNEARTFKGEFDNIINTPNSARENFSKKPNSDEIELFIFRQIFTAFNIFNKSHFNLSKLSNISMRVSIMKSIGYEPFFMVKNLILENSFVYESLSEEIEKCIRD